MLEKAPEPSLVLNKQTMRYHVVISAGGTKVRVRFSNEWGTVPMKIGQPHCVLRPMAVRLSRSHSVDFLQG